MVTGEAGEPSRHQVIVAHLMPRDLPNIAFQQMGLEAEDRDGMRNVIPLCKGIEDCFDKKRISFYRTKDNSTKFRIKVWDQGARKVELWKMIKNDVSSKARGSDGKPLTVGDFVDREFEFPDGKMPFTRVLSYHYGICFGNALDEGWIQPEDAAKHMEPWRGSPIVDKDGNRPRLNQVEVALEYHKNSPCSVPLHKSWSSELTDPTTGLSTPMASTRSSTTSQEM